jgi:hypothetical protein
MLKDCAVVLNFGYRIKFQHVSILFFESLNEHILGHWV